MVFKKSKSLKVINTSDKAVNINSEFSETHNLRIINSTLKVFSFNSKILTNLTMKFLKNCWFASDIFAIKVKTLSITSLLVSYFNRSVNSKLFASAWKSDINSVGFLSYMNIIQSKLVVLASSLTESKYSLTIADKVSGSLTSLNSVLVSLSKPRVLLNSSKLASLNLYKTVA